MTMVDEQDKARENEPANPEDAPAEPQPIESAPENDSGAAPAAEEGEVSKDSTEIIREGMNWYVLRVASNKEGRVRTALERKIKIEGLDSLIGRVMVPTQKEKRMRSGTARVVHRKLYPGYVFVEMATDPDGSVADDVWFLIKETSGVGDFIGSEGKPSAMERVDVEKMLMVALTPDETPALANLSFKPGEKVKVREGPFENFEGVVEDINTQKGTVRVVVTIFGRSTPIEIEYWQVEQL